MLVDFNLEFITYFQYDVIEKTTTYNLTFALLYNYKRLHTIYYLIKI